MESFNAGWLDGYDSCNAGETYNPDYSKDDDYLFGYSYGWDSAMAEGDF